MAKSSNGIIVFRSIVPGGAKNQAECKPRNGSCCCWYLHEDLFINTSHRKFGNAKKDRVPVVDAADDEFSVTRFRHFGNI